VLTYPRRVWSFRLTNESYADIGITFNGLTRSAVAERQGGSAPTARCWWHRPWRRPCVQ